MLFDNEDEILEYARDNVESSGLIELPNSNSFTKKIRRCILNGVGLISDVAHSALPPDYYSDTYSIMFDVLRVNDSEIKKSYNPVKMRERQRHNEILKSFGDVIAPGGKIMIVSESDSLTEHIYKNYVKNAQRVIGEHIRKIPLWQKKCSQIKYKGLFVFDETEVYYKGISVPSGYPESDRAWLRGVDIREQLHEPWRDINLVCQIYESALDFVVWFCPYKPCGVAMQIGMRYPGLVIVDTRFRTDKLIEYSKDLVC